MTERQKRKYWKYGIIPAWVKLVDKQLRSRTLDKPRTGSKGKNVIEELWQHVTFDELNP